ncbi:hypothetical protein AB0K09_18735 [Streptomyces sp. NPDC049577]
MDHERAPVPKAPGRIACRRTRAETGMYVPDCAGKSLRTLRVVAA